MTLRTVVADVEQSQSRNVLHHKAWVLVSMSGVVQIPGSSGTAGPGRSCSHAAPIM